MNPTRSDIERLLAARLDFLIGVGHDMRAPLTGIAGFAAVLAELDSVIADPTASEAVAYIRTEAHRLVDLLNQLLDFGHVEQGEPRLDLEPIDLVRLARQVVEPWANRHPEVSFRLVHTGEVVVHGDFMKLNRVIANLLDNAVRHSPVGGNVTLEINEAGESAVLAVTDQGSGIPLRDRSRVFGRFVRLSSELDPVSPGSGAGIGLYIVKGLVEAHGGSIEIEEAPGARFVIRLPIRAVESLAL